MTRFSQTNSGRLPLPLSHYSPLSSLLLLDPPKLRSFDFFPRTRRWRSEYSGIRIHIGSIAKHGRKGREGKSCPLRRERFGFSLVFQTSSKLSALWSTHTHTHTHFSPSLSSLPLSSRASLHREDISLRRSFSQSECSLISFEPFAPE